MNLRWCDDERISSFFPSYSHQSSTAKSIYLIVECIDDYTGIIESNRYYGYHSFDRDMLSIRCNFDEYQNQVAVIDAFNYEESCANLA